MFVRVCSDYADVISRLRGRTVEIQISRDGIDHLGGLSDRHASKLLCPRPTKILGPISQGPVLEVLGVKLMIVEDTAATERTMARRVAVKSTHQRFGNKNLAKSAAAAQIAAPGLEPTYAAHGSVSPILPAPPPVSRAHLRIIQSRRGASSADADCARCGCPDITGRERQSAGRRQHALNLRLCDLDCRCARSSDADRRDIDEWRVSGSRAAVRSGSRDACWQRRVGVFLFQLARPRPLRLAAATSRQPHRTCRFLGARPIPPTNERELLHRWHDRDNPSLWAVVSVFLDGPDHAEKF